MTFKKGDKVDYHSIIGGPVTKAGLTVTVAPYELNPGSKRMVAFVDGVRGCVAIEALTRAQESTNE